MGKIIHILLTYRCSYKCDHCFVYASPQARGTFTISQISHLLEDIARVENVSWVVFEGGEPFLRYSLLLQSIHKARNLGFQVGVITNGFFARNEATARRFLEPLYKMGVGCLCVSDDRFHYRNSVENSAKRALRTGEVLGIPVQCLNVEDEATQSGPVTALDAPPVSAEFKHTGRAVANLPVEGRFERDSLDKCRVSDLGDPVRLFLDAHGNVQVCQGLSIGNAWEKPLPELLAGYDSSEHPIINPLQRGGPRQLALDFGFPAQGRFVDACHLCYSVRKDQLEAFPQYLAPRQVYGIS